MLSYAHSLWVETVQSQLYDFLESCTHKNKKIRRLQRFNWPSQGSPWPLKTSYLLSLYVKKKKKRNIVKSVGALIYVCKILIFFVKYSKSYRLFIVLATFSYLSVYLYLKWYVFWYISIDIDVFLPDILCFLSIYINYFKSIFPMYVICEKKYSR